MATYRSKFQPAVIAANNGTPSAPPPATLPAISHALPDIPESIDDKDRQPDDVGLPPIEPMETRIDTHHRLRKSGKWEAATKWRLARQHELQRMGLPRRRAVDYSWLELQYYDLGPDEPLPPEAPISVAVPDLLEDAKWVFRHLDGVMPLPKHAPSQTAMPLLRLARKEKKWFLSIYLPGLRDELRKQEQHEKKMKDKPAAAEATRPAEDDAPTNEPSRAMAEQLLSQLMAEPTEATDPEAPDADDLDSHPA